jgi:hypothetical protein
MKFLKTGLIWLSLAAMGMSGCSTTQTRVLSINSLTSDASNDGSFRGLEALATGYDEKPGNRVNIIYLHGVGWIENPDDKPLANEFIKGLANAYNLEVDDKAVSSLCGRDTTDEATNVNNHIYIKEDSPKTYHTALPGVDLTLDDLVCLDRQVLHISDDLEYVIYRVFWDEIFWQSLQEPHVGYDDKLNTDGVAALRRKYNRYLKDKLINFGFSDAILYLGAVGGEIREAIYGAMCAANLDAGGFEFKEQGKRVTADEICQIANETSVETDQFVFVTESLGSKIAYDIMRDVMTDDKDTVHDAMIENTEFIMLANQVALLNLSDLGTTKPKLPPYMPPEERPTIVAFSEVNDFLSYELIPYYRSLMKNGERHSVFVGEDKRDISDNIVAMTGFNMIDMRVEFADPLIPLVKSFVDPLRAHNGHSAQPELMRYMVCGADNGKLRTAGCIADLVGPPIGKK